MPNQYAMVSAERNATNSYVRSLGFDPATGKCTNKSLAAQKGLDDKEISLISENIKQLNLKDCWGNYMHDNFWTATQCIDAILFTTADEVRDGKIDRKGFDNAKQHFAACAEEMRGVEEYNLNYFSTPSVFNSQG